MSSNKRLINVSFGTKQEYLGNLAQDKKGAIQVILSSQEDMEGYQIASMLLHSGYSINETIAAFKQCDYYCQMLLDGDLEQKHSVVPTLMVSDKPYSPHPWWLRWFPRAALPATNVPWLLTIEEIREHHLPELAVIR